MSILSGVFLAATLGTASAAQAALVVVPPDLAVGAQYRLVFVTAGTRDATSTNIDDYNTFVTNEARGGTPAIDTALDTALNAAGFDPNTITWKAIGSTATVDARDNTGTNPGTSTGVLIYLIDGNRVANNNADLWDSNIQNPINRDQNGVTIFWVRVWSGSTENGLGQTSSQLGQGLVVVGSSIFKDGRWIMRDSIANNFSWPLYAMSGVLTVPQNQPEPVTVPEPTSLLGYITLGGLMLGGAVRKARK